MKRLKSDIRALQSIQRFGDGLEAAIRQIQSDTAGFEVVRDAEDCIGRHWYGLRCRVNGKKTGVSLYLYIGLIYHPETRRGLVAELDEQNNPGVYQTVAQNTQEPGGFEINREEQEYFKLFMPEEVFESLSEKPGTDQVLILGDFVRRAGEAMIQAASEQGFFICYEQMEDALNLCNAFDRTLNRAEGEESRIWVNYKDRDNFGQYASGFRYHLSDKEGKVSLYAYFGVIYSYKKQPCGIFTEIDRNSNPDEFARVEENIIPSEEYELSRKEEGFLKLFLPRKKMEKFHDCEYEEQMSLLKRFVEKCNDSMICAWKKGGK